jgi:hypothetical protein
MKKKNKNKNKNENKNENKNKKKIKYRNEDVIFKNQVGYYCTKFHLIIIDLHALYWIIMHKRHSDEGT